MAPPPGDLPDDSHERQTVTLQGRKIRAGVLVAAGYYLGAQIGIALTIRPYPVSILWVPNAILLAALLLTPPRAWFFMLLAALPAHLAAELPSGVPLGMGISWFISNSAEALIGAGCARYFIGEPLRFDRFRHVALYVALAGFLGAFTSSFLDAGLVALNRFGSAGFWENWTVRFFSNLLAALTVVPVLVICATGGLQQIRAGLRARHAEAGLMALCLIPVSAWVFLGPPPGRSLHAALLLAPLPGLLWAAVRFGNRSTSLGVLAVAALAIVGSMLGQGPFVISSPAEHVLSLQLYLIALSVPLLGLAAVVEERVQAEDVLREAHEARSELMHLSRAAVLGELTGALAHELNQPLAAILANARAGQRLLDRETIDVKEVREILDDIAADDRRAGEVIRRLHALLKKGDLQTRPLNVNEVVNDALELVHSDLIQRSVAVDARLAPTLPTVFADPVQLQQVLLNLVINGCDAMADRDRGDRRLTIMTRYNEHGSVQLSIADSGTGIPADRMDRIFEPFFTSKQQGLGLGLSICRSIVRAHGGRLWAMNNPEGGATFHVELESEGQGISRLAVPERKAAHAAVP